MSLADRMDFHGFWVAPSRTEVAALESSHAEAVALLREAYDHLSSRYVLRQSIGEFLRRIDARENPDAPKEPTP